MTEIKYSHIKVNIIGQNGNAFCILGICQRAMEQANCTQQEIDVFNEKLNRGIIITFLQLL